MSRRSREQRVKCMTGGGESSGIKIANNKRSKCALEGIKNFFFFHLFFIEVLFTP